MALWVKPQPYYVSDATMADVLATVDRLRAAADPEARLVGRRCGRHSAAARSQCAPTRSSAPRCRSTPCQATSGQSFAGAALTVLKGDLNYRRLVGDRLWPPTTPFSETAGHFPSPVAALRVLKSDVAVGVEAAMVAELDGTGDPWRTSGRFAVVQVHTRR